MGHLVLTGLALRERMLRPDPRPSKLRCKAPWVTCPTFSALWLMMEPLEHPPNQNEMLEPRVSESKAQRIQGVGIEAGDESVFRAGAWTGWP